MIVMMHMHSGAHPDFSATPKAAEPFNIQPGSQIPCPHGSELSLTIGFCHAPQPWLVK
jgi:hypothetical protein